MNPRNERPIGRRAVIKGVAALLGGSAVSSLLPLAGRAAGAQAVADRPDEGNVMPKNSGAKPWSTKGLARSVVALALAALCLAGPTAGYGPLEPGYRRIEFRPEVPTRGLDRVSASYESVRGMVAIVWRRTVEGLDLDVTVPANATARVLVPARSPQAVTEVGGGTATPAERAESVRLVGAEGDRVVYEVGSGTYRFRVTVPEHAIGTFAPRVPSV